MPYIVDWVVRRQEQCSRYPTHNILGIYPHEDPQMMFNLLYTLEDLAAAEVKLKYWDDAFANDKSNNPNKYEAQRRDARREVRQISRELKRIGLLEKTEEEKLHEELDRAYPNARANSVVQYNGKMYRIRYFPVEQSRSRKTVKEWGHQWIAV